MESQVYQIVVGVFLGDEMLIQKNFEVSVEKIKGGLDNWKFLFSKLSYRGRVIINNLVASSLPLALASLCRSSNTPAVKDPVNLGQPLLRQSALGTTECFISA